MFVASTGMVCPVGLTSAEACAALRADIAMFEELPYHDNQGEPIIGAAVPGLNPDFRRGNRVLELLLKALTDCLANGSSIGTIRSIKVPLVIGLAEENRPGGGARLADTILERMQTKLGLEFHPLLSRVLSRGHTAGFEALHLAREFLKESNVPACLVGAVDSYINASTLQWLDQHWRLKTPANQHGLIPGEAAAAILLCAEPEPKTTVEVAGLGFGREEAHVLAEEPLLGLGLTEAARTALTESELDMHEMDWRMSDVTGEQYGFKELPLVEGRLVRVIRKQPQPLWHCADSIGDTGAAAGVAQLVVADAAFRKEYAPGERAICFCGSVPGDRAVAVLRRFSG